MCWSGASPSDSGLIQGRCLTNTLVTPHSHAQTHALATLCPFKLPPRVFSSKHPPPQHPSTGSDINGPLISVRTAVVVNRPKCLRLAFISVEKLV